MNDLISFLVGAITGGAFVLVIMLVAIRGYIDSVMDGKRL